MSQYPAPDFDLWWIAGLLLVITAVLAYPVVLLVLAACAIILAVVT